MSEISMKDVLKRLKEDSIGLDEIHVSVSENTKLKISKKRLTVSTWMKMYKDAKTLEEKKCLREAAISITETFGYKNSVSEHGTFTEKFKLSAPYNFFLTTVYRLEETFKQPYSLAFHEIINYTQGEIVDSLYFTFELDLLWLATEYMLASQYPKMTVMCGTLMDPSNRNQIPFDITILKAKMPNKFGCHHSKISILKYKNGSVRILIATANLRRSDWEEWTQGMWVSPILPPLPQDAADSDEYCLFTIPGNHEFSTMNFWGHKRLYNILRKHVSLPENATYWPIVSQSSSVGNLGQHYNIWTSGHIVRSMALEKNKKIIHFPEFRFLYPTEETYKKSFDVEMGSTSLAYYKEQHLKQQWLQESHLYQWTFEKSGRARAMPHCKCYTRISPDETEIAWFILTSANLSKGGWGKMINKDTIHYITKYEAGVIFIPQIMIEQSTFPIEESPVFLLPYDKPLSPYGPGMEVAVKPGERPTYDLEEEKEQPKTNILEQEQTENFYKDDRVKKILEALL